MPEASHRRTLSELDIPSLRRLSDALLLAQNRARRATDRANRTAHVLRMVLNQVEGSRLRIDSFVERDMLQTVLTPSAAAFSMPSPLPVANVGGLEIAASVTSPSMSSSSFSLYVTDVARNVVDNLNVAMARHKRDVVHWTGPTLPRFSRWRDTNRDGCFGPVPFGTGLVAGMVLGVVLTKQWQLQVMRPPQQEATLSRWGKLLTQWWSRRAPPVAGTPWHFIPLPRDEYRLFVHPTTVEVA